MGRGAGGASGTELIQQNERYDGVHGEEQDPMSSQDGALMESCWPFPGLPLLGKQLAQRTRRVPKTSGRGKGAGLGVGGHSQAVLKGRRATASNKCPSRPVRPASGC